MRVFLRYPLFIFLGLVALVSLLAFVLHTRPVASPKTSWEFQSVDTMKYSRDLAREKLSDASFDKVIDQQMTAIAQTGATHVAIATPYDKEFLPMLQRWVRSARKHNLKIWFRGNFSGWEEWFGYEKIDDQTHIRLTKEFIVDNAILFKDGDIFTSCPECENGKKLDAGNKAQMNEYTAFLLAEYRETKNTFALLGKDVTTNYYSMNGTIARAMMDKETTAAFDGVVVVDHYVRDPETLAMDLHLLAEQSGGQIVLGEFGAPIPDLQGNMTDEEQRAWLQESLERLSSVPSLIGVNYWVNAGGSTAIWSDTGKKKPAVDVLTMFYSAKVIQGKIVNEAGEPIDSATITAGSYTAQTDSTGIFGLPYLPPESSLLVVASGYKPRSIFVSDPYKFTPIVLEKDDNLFFQFLQIDF